MTQPVATLNCCASMFSRAATSIETKYNTLVGKIAGHTFQSVNHLQTTAKDNTFVKVAKVALSVLSAVITVPALFAAKYAVTLWNAVRSVAVRETSHPATAPEQAAAATAKAADEAGQAVLNTASSVVETADSAVTQAAAAASNGALPASA